MERGAKTVPIHLVFGSHSSDRISDLDYLRNGINLALSSNTEGKVAVFMEEASFIPAQANFVQQMMQYGVLPSDSLALVTSCTDEGKLLFPHELKKWKENHPVDPFVEREIEIFDEAYRRFRGRLLLFPESNPEEELISLNAITLEEKTKKLVNKGDFKNALVSFREEIEVGAKSMALRDKRIADNIETGLKEDKTILLFISFLGACHTGIFHNLYKKGFNVTRFFPEMDNGAYLYDPYSVILRARRFSPERLFADEELIKSMIMNFAFSILYLSANAAGDSMSRCKLVQVVNESLGNIGIKEIKKIQALTKKYGNFPAGILKFNGVSDKYLT